MKIGIVNQWYPPDYGGVAVYNAYIARAYADLGHCVTVITARGDRAQPSVEIEGNVRVMRLDRWVEPYRVRHVPLIGRYVRTLRHLLYSAGVQQLLKRLIAAGELDIAEFAEINAEGLVPLLMDRSLPAVVRCHTPHVLLDRTIAEDRGYDMKLIARLESAFVRRASAVTAPSAHLALAIEREMGLPVQTVQVIPNPIDTEEFSPGAACSSERHPEEPVTILYAGRLGHEKGIFVLADALTQLAQGDGGGNLGPHTRWRAVFAGADRPSEGDESNAEKLRRFFAERGLAHRVELRGFVPQDELVSLYRSADVCVVPSIFYESFSYTCVQAMACGKPIIASRMGGMPEVVIDGETGFLVTPGDAGELACALGKVLVDPSLRERFGRTGRERTVRLYKPSVVAEQNLALYRRVLSPG